MAVQKLHHSLLSANRLVGSRHKKEERGILFLSQSQGSVVEVYIKLQCGPINKLQGHDHVLHNVCLCIFIHIFKYIRSYPMNNHMLMKNFLRWELLGLYISLFLMSKKS